MKKNKRLEIDPTHPYGSYDPLVGCVCLYEEKVSATRYTAVIVYGAYDVDDMGRFYAILMENERGLVHALSGVQRSRLIPLASDSIEAKTACHRLIAGAVDQKRKDDNRT